MRWLALLLLCPTLAWAGSNGDTPTYGRDVGFETHLFYVASGNGAGKIEYVCKAFAGTTGSDDPTSSVWQVMKITYNSSHKIQEVNFAGDDDAFTQQCSNRASLNYD